MVGEAGDGPGGIEAAVQLAPDVVLMALNLPGRNGVEATRAITARSAGTAVLVLSMIDAEDSIFAAMRAGARGYLLKDAGRAELARAVEAVAHGEVVFSAEIASRGPGLVRRRWDARGVTPFPLLTEREREVLDLLARGLTNSAIARRLVVSDKTVRNPRVQRLRQAARAGSGRGGGPGARCRARRRAGLRQGSEGAAQVGSQPSYAGASTAARSMGMPSPSGTDSGAVHGRRRTRA